MDQEGAPEISLFTPNEAQKLIPSLKKWMAKLMDLNRKLEKIGFDVFRGRYEEGRDPNGEGPYPDAFASFVVTVQRFSESGVHLRSIDEGVVGFHSKRDSGEVVLLVWHYPEDQIEWWHPIETGYGDRRPLLDF
ncbi:DUF2203 family protein [bacterium]|nr:DUF2203 family protein [bacterium]